MKKNILISLFILISYYAYSQNTHIVLQNTSEKPDTLNSMFNTFEYNIEVFLDINDTIYVNENTIFFEAKLGENNWVKLNPYPFDERECIPFESLNSTLIFNTPLLFHYNDSILNQFSGNSNILQIRLICNGLNKTNNQNINFTSNIDTIYFDGFIQEDIDAYLLAKESNVNMHYFFWLQGGFNNLKFNILGGLSSNYQNSKIQDYVLYYDTLGTCWAYANDSPDHKLTITQKEELKDKIRPLLTSNSPVIKNEAIALYLQIQYHY